MKVRVLARAFLGACAAAATCVILAGQFGRAEQALDQFNALLPLLLPWLALILAFALRLRDRVTVAIAVLGLGLGGFQFGAAALADYRLASDPAPSSGTVKILTFSTYHANPAPETIRALIAAQAPDIAVLQEADGKAAAVVDRLLPSYYRIKSCKWTYCHLTILSRWPIRQVNVRYAQKSARPNLLIAQVEAPFGRFRVVDVHLPRPYKDDAQATMATLASVARADTTIPLIMAGDFNAATGSFGLRRFAAASGLRQIEGFVPTYPANRPMPAFAGIDHVFADARWSSAGCRRTSAAHSDHYGVVCRLRLKDRSRSRPSPGAAPPT